MTAPLGPTAHEQDVEYTSARQEKGAVFYTDGTEIKEGDLITSVQQPGGWLPPGPKAEGIAGPCPHAPNQTLHLIRRENGHLRYIMIAGHINERWVRKVCAHCPFRDSKEAFLYEPDGLAKLEAGEIPRCHDAGGRVGLFERGQEINDANRCLGHDAYRAGEPGFCLPRTNEPS